MRGFGACLTLGVLALALGCAGKDTTVRACASDGDCGAGEHCARSARPGEQPAILPSCPFTPCSESVPCASGQRCIAAPAGNLACGPMVCFTPCTDTSCGADQVCRDTGYCETRTCNDPGGIVCPEHFHCDPEHATAGALYGSALADPPNAYDASVHGCARLTCDEDLGYTCSDYWTCDPQHSTNPSGCVPVPCTESGHCADDNMICTPTSSHGRSPGNDFFGCVHKNCEEGLDCEPLTPRPGVEYCDFSAKNADADGCAIRTCAEGNPCVSSYTCEPDSPAADTLGCVPGADGGSGAASGGGIGGTGGGTGSAGSVGSGGVSGSGGSGGTGGATASGANGGADAGASATGGVGATAGSDASSGASGGAAMSGGGTMSGGDTTSGAAGDTSNMPGRCVR